MKAVATCLLLLAFSGGASADRPPGRAEDEKAIRSNVEAYVAAFRKKDAAAVAAFWAEDGRFISPLSGEALSGRERIQGEFAEMFSDAEAFQLEVEVTALRFLTADVAVEEGVATVISPGQPPSESSYQVIHKKQEGAWLIDSVRETLLPQVSPAEQQEAAEEMEPLAWMVGDWIDAGDGSTIYLSCRLGMGGRYLRRDFEVAIADRIEMSGVEVIGWDAAEETWRSWVFDSEGGFGSALWKKDGETFIKDLSGTTRTGQRAFATQTLTRIDKTRSQWRSDSREADGEILPNIETVTVIRQNTEKEGQ